jgi:hypothetical protein
MGAQAWGVYEYPGGGEVRVGASVDWDTPDALPQLRAEVTRMLGEAIVCAEVAAESLAEDDEA